MYTHRLTTLCQVLPSWHDAFLGKYACWIDILAHGILPVAGVGGTLWSLADVSVASVATNSFSFHWYCHQCYRIIDMFNIGRQAMAALTTTTLYFISIFFLINKPNSHF